MQSHKGIMSCGIFQSDQESSQDNDADDEGLRRRTRRQLHDGLHPSVIPKLSPAKNSQKRPSPNGPQSVQTRYEDIFCPKCVRGFTTLENICEDFTFMQSALDAGMSWRMVAQAGSALAAVHPCHQLNMSLTS